MPNDHFNTVVVGGGQAGIAMGRQLQHRNLSFLILEAEDRIGEQWRRRWDSLHLFTPAKFSGLPEMEFPADRDALPSKDETAAYLQAYAERFELPVRLNTRVERLSHDGKTFVISAGRTTFLADHVVVATGAFSRPFIPDFSSELSPTIIQIHSDGYRNSGQLPGGGILVVGAGNSGAEIALEAAADRRQVWLSGRDTGRIPADKLGRLFDGKPYWWILSHLLSEATPVGRRVKKSAVRTGTPLIGTHPEDIIAAGIHRVPRVTGVENGRPRLEDGTVLDVSGIVWATGFRPDYRWIDLDIFDSEGRPVHRRGVVAGVPGLYFLGLHFQYSLSSALLGGVGTDAEYLAKHIHRWQSGRIRDGLGVAGPLFGTH